MKHQTQVQGLAWNIGLDDVAQHAGAPSAGFSDEAKAARKRYVRNKSKARRRKIRGK